MILTYFWLEQKKKVTNDMETRSFSGRLSDKMEIWGAVAWTIKESIVKRQLPFALSMRNVFCIMDFSEQEQKDTWFFRFQFVRILQETGICL